MGRVRSLNEDRFLELPERGLWAVADGMGGHRAGDVAAQLVVDALAGTVATATIDDIRKAVNEANRSLLHHSAYSNLGVSGSTLVVMKIAGGRYDCLWAGDSQAWLFRGNSWSQLTRDHSVVEDLVDAGAIARHQRQCHPQRHVITRAVGVGTPLLLDHVQGTFMAGDILLLCSDGLSGVVDLNEVTPAEGLEKMADDLLSEALEAGAPDNVTFVLISCGA